MSQDSSTAIDKAETNFRSSICWMVIFEHILIVLSFIVLADNGNSLIFLRISALFLKSRNSSSDAFIKQLFMYSPSVYGFPLLAISWLTTKLAILILLEDCIQLLNTEVDDS